MNKGKGTSQPNAMGVDFKAIANRLKASDHEQMLNIASSQLPHNVGILKGIMEAFIPVEHQTNFYLAVSAVMSSTAQIAMMEYRMATKAVDHEASEQGSRAKGEASRALTWRVADETQDTDGNLLPFKLLTAAVNAERAKQTEPKLGAIEERQVRRHIKEGRP